MKYNIKGKGYSLEELKTFMADCNNVYLYGTGKVALKLANLLKENGIEWLGFVTTLPNDEGKTFFDHNVYCIDDINFEKNDGIVLAVAEKTHAEIMSIIKEKRKSVKIYQQRIFGRTINIPVGYLKGADKEKGFFGRFQELNKWGEVFDTDKHHKAHDYLRKYELFLQYYKEKEFTLLELGVFRGGSLNTWGGIKSDKGYFDKAKIIGVDIDPACCQYVDKQEVIIKDLGVAENLEELKTLSPSVIVDDASHFCSHQIMALLVLWDVLPSGGIYIMEDVDTSFNNVGYVGFNDTIISAYDVCQNLAECVTSGGESRNDIPMKKQIEVIASQIDMISFIHGSCVMIKK
ncbi:hypothetical protein NZ47_11375 [Anaerovibrio lipolyticus]|uniref:Methyltransferase n=1 Tax=Anaerovibrio lipolyticus TaxID=82374 RepID=A0A0B2JX68_9FIRM|nr:hypothetical protein [Anaerovibrio lipolyticus]KHM51278.1 hypothetical protein NZ47_11375 [Anaerovibrio lipolyticus]